MPCWRSVRRKRHGASGTSEIPGRTLAKRPVTGIRPRVSRQGRLVESGVISAKILPVTALPNRIVIATRESALALWQAEHVRARLVAAHPGLAVELLGMTTEGDRNLGSTLAKIGGKGLFVKELEDALLDGRADIAVHSMKDVPVNPPHGFRIQVIDERDDPRDAFVSNRHDSVDALPAGARVGTSSLRRESQLRAHRPDLVVAPVRGNVQTRLRKLDEGQFDAILLAGAGLRRLALTDRIRAWIPPEESIPAVGQGALGVEFLEERDELRTLLAPLVHAETSWCVSAERAMSRALAGNCTAPLGGFAELSGSLARLTGFVALPDGTRLERACAEASWLETSPEALGESVASRLISAGAREILADAESAR
ncbi:MAG: hydroxymethylbilane synthase [Betaproteobacteria bacterium]|nr:hydroxymethylbilane synthase [Betaproteobacteria bacterium]